MHRLGLLLLVLLAGCRGEVSSEPQLVLIRNMFHQPKVNAQSASAFFADGRSMRTPPEGTLSREEYIESVEVETGLTNQGRNWVATLPDSVVVEAGGMGKLLERGRERFNIYCAPCHDRTGGGDGTVVLRGFQKPPPLHDPRLLHAPDGQLFATIGNGIRNMPAYGAQVRVPDRWAIVAYVRALQLAQASEAKP